LPDAIRTARRINNAALTALRTLRYSLVRRLI